MANLGPFLEPLKSPIALISALLHQWHPYPSVRQRRTTSPWMRTPSGSEQNLDNPLSLDVDMPRILAPPIEHAWPPTQPHRMSTASSRYISTSRWNSASDQVLSLPRFTNPVSSDRSDSGCLGVHRRSHWSVSILQQITLCASYKSDHRPLG
ncbi:hypothetical protein BDW22DRAFT_710225 [Trametopsis cervina]|nr:hypothetical protein BDW22DRAFT_710225 [Trametopsis cervina]